MSASTILLRCTVESTEPNVQNNCATTLAQLLEWLKFASAECGWDLADFAIERCGESISRVASFVNAVGKTIATEQPQLQTADVDDVLDTQDLQDLLLPVDSLDFPWETLWDTTEGLWPTYI